MRTLGRVLRAIGAGIVKVSALLLVSFGLWLPALFTVAFFIVCAVRGIHFGGGAAAVFWCGLGITAVAGVTLALHRKQKQMMRGGVVPASSEKNAESKRERKRKDKSGGAPTENANENAYAPYGYMPPQGYMQQPVYMQPPVYMQQPPVYAQPPVYGSPAQAQPSFAYAPQQQPPAPRYAPETPPANDTRDLQYKYFGDVPNTATATVPTGEQAYGQSAWRASGDASGLAPQANASEADMLWRRLSGGLPDEQPLIFRTRRDPDVFVYEYSDRYQYWRRTKSGMLLEQTEYKQNPSRRGR